MIEINLYFIVSQILVFFALIFDFVGMQFKARKKIILFLGISASLISAHYFFLGKIAAGIIIIISLVRYITCYFTTNKKYLYLFILLSTLTLIFTYRETFDLIIYFGILSIIVGNFQSEEMKLRKIMMVGTSTLIIYNIIIFSPMGAIVEGSLLISNIIGYYRHHYKIKEKIKLKT